MLPLTKRQREILDYLNEFIQQHGYAPSLEEIGRRFGLSSLATVHKHLTNLQEKGFIKRAWNRSRSVEMVPTRTGGRAVELPLLGYVAAGVPIEAVASNETIAVPEDLVGKRDTYVLRVRGDSMIDEQIRDGDFVVVEDRKTRRQRRDGHRAAARDRRHAQEVLPRPRRQDPPAAGQRRDAADLRRSRPGADSGRRRRGDAEVLSDGRRRAVSRTSGSDSELDVDLTAIRLGHGRSAQADQLHHRSGRRSGGRADAAHLRELLLDRAHAVRLHAHLLRGDAALREGNQGSRVRARRPRAGARQGRRAGAVRAQPDRRAAGALARLLRVVQQRRLEQGRRARFTDVGIARQTGRRA